MIAVQGLFNEVSYRQLLSIYARQFLNPDLVDEAIGDVEG